MKYRELKIRVERSDLEKIEALLIDHGYTSMMIDDPDDVRDILAHPDTYRYDYISDELTADMDRQPEITLYFGSDEQGMSELANAEALLRDAADNSDIEFLSTETEDDSEWLYRWQEHFKPTRVGERIVVKPSWEEYEPTEKDLVIEMDPGMAFGSGLHETTSMCIKALERILGKDDAQETGRGCKPEIKVLDVGCGTGILAIAAALLGADECLGIDIDPDAVRVAEENIRHNGLEEKITAQYGDLTEGVDYEADIVVANLMADLVIRLTSAVRKHLRPGGKYITSGILDIKEDVCREAIEAEGFRILDILRDGEWRAIVAEKR
ncbi:MAG: 50S ribosomal protein L11 methyltransferase [Mogibacterium sp.]|nr:50S ribosomal protein L11 methyltransferase [Mogibacterium sp.]